MIVLSKTGYVAVTEPHKFIIGMPFVLHIDIIKDTIEDWVSTLTTTSWVYEVAYDPNPFKEEDKRYVVIQRYVGMYPRVSKLEVLLDDF